MAGPSYPQTDPNLGGGISRPHTDPWMGQILKRPHRPSLPSSHSMAGEFDAILKKPFNPSKANRLPPGRSLPGLISSPGGRSLAKSLLKQALKRGMPIVGQLATLMDIIKAIDGIEVTYLDQPEVPGVTAHWAHPGYTGSALRCTVHRPEGPIFTTLANNWTAASCTTAQHHWRTATDVTTGVPSTGQTYWEVWRQWNATFHAWDHCVVQRFIADSSGSEPDPHFVEAQEAQPARASIVTDEMLQERIELRALDTQEGGEPALPLEEPKVKTDEVPAIEHDFGRGPGEPPAPPTWVAHGKRPPDRKKEHETKGKVNTHGLAKLANILGSGMEYCEMVDAVYGTLPAKVRRWRGRDGKWRDREITCWGRAGAILANLQHVNAQDVVKALLENEIGDRVGGLGGKMGEKAAKNLKVRSVQPSRIPHSIMNK